MPAFSSSSEVSWATLQADLQAATLRELLQEWHRLNQLFFGGAMQPPSLRFLEGEKKLGEYSPSPKCISLAYRLVFEHSWGETIEVLKHEMAHQYVFEVLCVIDEMAHGRAFQEICARLGIDASASGLPGVTNHPEEESRVLERIARLLALAKSSNEHEAQAAMKAAQRLMLRYNLSAVGRSQTYQFRHLGPVSGRLQESERWLATILHEHFFVETIWVPSYQTKIGKKGTVLEVCGTPANLDMAAYVHSFLRGTAERLWLEHKRSTGERANKDRQKFLAGVMIGFREKLGSQETPHKQEGLVWIKDANLEEYLHRRYPRVRTVRYRNGRNSMAYEQGREAGRSIVLHRPVSEGTSGGVKLLGSGRG